MEKKREHPATSGSDPAENGPVLAGSNRPDPFRRLESEASSKGSTRVPPAGVVLVHGLTGNPSEMRPIGRYLEKKGFAVKAPLLAGHGGGHQQLLDSTWQDWFGSVKSAIDEFDKVLNPETEKASSLASRTPVFLVGLSMGALLSALASVHDPRIQGVILLSTTLGYPGKDLPITRHLLPMAFRIPLMHRHFYWTEKEPYGLKDQRLQRMIKRSIEASKRGESKDYGLFRTYVGSLYQYHQLKETFFTQAGQVQCPCLMIHSQEDTIASIDNAFAAYSALGCQQKSVELITGCDHVMTVDLQKLDVAARIERFIRNQLGLSAAGTDCQRMDTAWEVA